MLLALRIRITRIALASAISLAAAGADAQATEGPRGVVQSRQMSVALEPARTPLFARIAGGALLLVVVLGALGRRRARSERIPSDPNDRGHAVRERKSP